MSQIPLFDPEIGKPFSDTNAFSSQAKLNAKTTLIADAAYLNTFGNWYPGQPIRVIGTETVGIWKPNRTYYVDESGTEIIPDTLFKHRHLADTDEDGGKFIEIRRFNIHKTASAPFLFPSASNFKKIVTNTGNIIDNESTVDFVTGNIINDYTIGRLQGGPGFNCAVPMSMLIYGYANAGTMISIKLGIGMENVNFQEGLDRRLGLEACDVVSQARKYHLVSGDGNSWNMDPTDENVSQTAPRALRLDLRPLQELRFTRVDSGVRKTLIKTGNVPGSGSIPSGKCFVLGLRTNDTGEKTYKLAGIQIEAENPDQLWGDPLTETL